MCNGFIKIIFTSLTGLVFPGISMPGAPRILPLVSGLPADCSVLALCRSEQECLDVNVPVLTLRLDQKSNGFAMIGISADPISIGLFRTIDAAMANLNESLKGRDFGTVLASSTHLVDVAAYNLYSVAWQAGRTCLGNNFKRISCKRTISVE